MEKKIKGSSHPLSYKKLTNFLETSKKCMCKIINYKDNSVGSGFFCKFNNVKECNNIQKTFLMTNNHVIDLKYFESTNKLYIEIEEKEKMLDLDNRIKITDKENDFTIIEIKSFDKIFDYFEVYSDIMNSEENLKEKDIIIPQFPGGNELSIAFGTIIKIEGNIINYNVSTEYGSSGSPILTSDNMKIIGIHNKRELDLNENKGIFMKSILNYIRTYKEKEKIDMSKNLDISNLILNKTIDNGNEHEIEQIVLLKDGRLCSLDSFGDIKIYNKKNYGIDIYIKNNDERDKKILIGCDIKCLDDNILLSIIENIFYIYHIVDSKNYKIMQIIDLSEQLGSSYGINRYIDFTEKSIIVYACTVMVSLCKIGNTFKIQDVDHDFFFHYLKKIRYKQWDFECRFFSGRPPPSLLFYKNGKKMKDIDDKYLGILSKKRQLLLVEPSYIIIGSKEVLIDLNKDDDFFIEDEVFRNKAFKNENTKDIYSDYWDGCYENLNQSSFIFLDKVLLQLNIISSGNSINFEICSKREDISGNNFLRSEDNLYIVNGNKILIYYFS